MDASQAKTFGSATSSVWKPRHIRLRIPSSAMTTQAACNPARLKALLADRQVILFCRHDVFTEAKGRYFFPGSQSSQWISSLMTITWCFLQSALICVSSSLLHNLPIGLCGLHRTISDVSGSCSFCFRSIKSISYTRACSFHQCGMTAFYIGAIPERIFPLEDAVVKTNIAAFF